MGERIRRCYNPLCSEDCASEERRMGAQDTQPVSASGVPVAQAVPVGAPTYAAVGANPAPHMQTAAPVMYVNQYGQPVVPHAVVAYQPPAGSEFPLIERQMRMTLASSIFMIILGILGGVYLIGLIAGVLLCIGASMVVCKCCGVTRTTVVRTGYLALSAAILSAVNSILFIVILANNTYTWGTNGGRHASLLDMLRDCVYLIVQTVRAVCKVYGFSPDELAPKRNARGRSSSAAAAAGATSTIRQPARKS